MAAETWGGGGEGSNFLIHRREKKRRTRTAVGLERGTMDKTHSSWRGGGRAQPKGDQGERGESVLRRLGGAQMKVKKKKREKSEKRDFAIKGEKISRREKCAEIDRGD